MRKILAGLTVAGFVVAMSAPLLAATETVKGQIVDEGCYKMDKSNTGGHNYDESKGVVAHNAVHHSKQYPSQITVTVVRRAQTSSAQPGR